MAGGALVCSAAMKDEEWMRAIRWLVDGAVCLAVALIISAILDLGDWGQLYLWLVPPMTVVALLCFMKARRIVGELKGRYLERVTS